MTVLTARSLRVTLVVVALLAVTTLAGCLNDFNENRLNEVRIQGIDVSAPVVATGTVTLLVNVTLDNRHAESGPLRLVLKAHNTATGLLETTVEHDVGTLRRDRTEAAPVEIQLPKQDSYRITAHLYQDEVLIHEARVQVSQVAALRNNFISTGLRVSDLEFLVQNVSSGRVQIDTQVYLTNQGRAPSEPLRLQIKAREVSTGLLAAETWADVEAIPVEATRIQQVLVEVPEAYNYLVAAVLWNGEFLVGDGEGRVQLLPTFTVPKDEQIVVDRPAVEDFVAGRGDSFDSADDSGATPGPALLLVALTLVALAAWLRRRT